MRVNLEATVWTDARFVVLAKLMGWPDPDLAIIKVAKVWRQCVMEGVYELPAGAIDALLGSDGCRSLIASGLAEPTDKEATRARVKGTRGRIEWHKNSKENGKKGGRPRAISDKQKTQGVLKEKPSSSSSSSSSPSSSTDRESADAATSAATLLSAKRSQPAATTLPASWTPTEEHERFASLHGIPLRDEADKFRHHAEANGRRQVRWNAAFSQWLIQAKQYTDKDRAKNGDTRQWTYA